MRTHQAIPTEDAGSCCRLSMEGLQQGQLEVWGSHKRDHLNSYTEDKELGSCGKKSLELGKTWEEQGANGLEVLKQGKEACWGVKVSRTTKSLIHSVTRV